ncbi:MAG: sigma-70 family RNA polymerase sigma factor [Phycisphaerales bacterium]
MDKLGLFEILIRQQSDMLRCFLRSIAFDKQLVDDVFQDTIVAAWKQIDEFDRTRPIGPWLRGIARNCLLAAARQHRRAIVSDEAVVQHIDGHMSHLDDQPGDTFPERSAALRDCMERLGNDEREAIDLCYVRDMPANRAAEVAHITHDAMRKRLQRARSSLSECLRRHGVLGGVE